MTQMKYMDEYKIESCRICYYLWFWMRYFRNQKFTSSLKGDSLVFKLLAAKVYKQTQLTSGEFQIIYSLRNIGCNYTCSCLYLHYYVSVNNKVSIKFMCSAMPL